MNKKLIIYTIAIVTVTTIGASYASSRASSTPDSVNIPQDCQYPTRPLVDGHCNNTDPANPETDIKGTMVKQNPTPKPIIKKPTNSCLQATK